MMGTKVFQTHGTAKLVSDERDIMVPTKHRLAVLDWCAANGIVAELALGSTQSAIAAYTFGVNLWRVKNEKQRVAFALRWA